MAEIICPLRNAPCVWPECKPTDHKCEKAVSDVAHGIDIDGAPYTAYFIGQISTFTLQMEIPEKIFVDAINSKTKTNALMPDGSIAPKNNP